MLLLLPLGWHLHKLLDQIKQTCLADAALLLTGFECTGRNVLKYAAPRLLGCLASSHERGYFSVIYLSH